MSSRLLLNTCMSTLCKLERCNQLGAVGARYLSSQKTPAVQRDLIEVGTDPEKAERRLMRPRITIDHVEDVSIVSGVPEEHIKTRTARIYQPPKNAMQSGTDNINYWQIDFENRERWENQLMGWSSTGDPLSNVKVEFATKDEAIKHCEKMNWKYYVQKPNPHDPKARSYGANFSWNKRTRVSTK